MKSGDESAMVDQTDMEILACLRKNSRETLTTISRETGIPISSVFDRLKRLEASGVITRYTSLLDMKRLWLHVRVLISVKVPETVKYDLDLWLKENPQVTSLMKVTGEWSYMAEALFRDIKTLEGFMDILSKDFQEAQCSVHYVLEDLKREAFSPG